MELYTQVKNWLNPRYFKANILTEIKKEIDEEKQKEHKNIRESLANPYVLIVEGLIILLVSVFILNILINFFTATWDAITSIDLSQGLQWNTEMFNALIMTTNHFTNMNANILFFTVIGILVLFIANKLYRQHRRYRKLSTGQKGDSRFTTIKEMKKQYKKVPHKEKTYKGESGFPISHYRDHYFIDDSTSNTCIIGTSRSGKGQTAVIPAIDIDSRAEFQPCQILGDPKGELYVASYLPLRRRGYDVFALNLLDPDNGMSYNLLEIIKQSYEKGDFAQAQSDCSTLTNSLFMSKNTKGEPFWDESGAKLTNALILATVERCYSEGTPEKITMGNVYRMLLELGQVEEDEDGNEKSKLDEYFDALPQDHIAKAAFAQLKFSKNNTRSSIYAVTTGKLEIFSRIQIDKMTSKNSLDLNRIGFNKRMNLFMDKKLSGQRGEIHFKSDSDDPIIETFRIDSFGYANVNFNFKLEDGDLIDVKMNGDTQFVTYSFERIKIGVDEYTGEDAYDEEVKLEIVEEQGDHFLQLAKIYYSERPIAIFMIIPDYDSSRNSIASIFISQLYTTLARSASLTRGNKCHQRVKIRLDEFGNLPAIHDMDTNITVSLGRNILWELYVQGYSQLDAVYGKEAAKTIKDNCQNHIYIMSTDEDTAKEISSKCGSRTKQETTRTGPEIGREMTLTDSTVEEPIIRPQKLMQIKEGNTVVLRFLKRTDKKGKKVTAFPIKNFNELSMPYAYTFIGDTFDTRKFISDFDIESEHRNLQIKDLLIDWLNRETKQASYLVEQQLKPQQLEKLKEYILTIGGNERFFTMLQKQTSETQFDQLIASLSANMKMKDAQAAKQRIIETVHKIIDGEVIEAVTEDKSHTKDTTEQNEEIFLDYQYYPGHLYERLMNYLEQHFSKNEIEDELKHMTFDTFRNSMINQDKKYIFDEIVRRFRTKNHKNEEKVG